MADFIVKKECFYMGKRYREGSTVTFDGDKVPDYFEKVITEETTIPKSKKKIYSTIEE